MTIYALKPRFQALLRPVARRLHAVGVSANQVTLFAGAVSVALGVGLYALPLPPAAFAALPAWMLLRMACNAIDGLIAREFGRPTALGALLNELGDVAADAALLLPFAAVAPFDPAWVAAVALLAALAEMAGALGPTIGATRRYDGPLGKSDRAAVLGVLGAWVAAGGPLPAAAGWLMPLLAALLAWTLLNRVRRAVAEAAAAGR